MKTQLHGWNMHCLNWSLSIVLCEHLQTSFIFFIYTKPQWDWMTLQFSCMLGSWNWKYFAHHVSKPFLRVPVSTNVLVEFIGAALILYTAVSMYTQLLHYFNYWCTCTLVTCSSSSQWAGRLGWPASSLPPLPLPLLVTPSLLDLLWHCPLPLHEGRQQPCFTGGTGTAEGCCTTHHLSAQLCTSAVSCTSLHSPLHWLCRWTVTASTQVTGGLTALSLSLWLVDMCKPLCEEQ